MAYGDDIDALGALHRYSFDGDILADTGSVVATNSGCILTGTGICEDVTNCLTTNGLTDRVTLAATSTINSSAQTRKAVCGWFMASAIQAPPTRIYGEGTTTTTFQFVLAMGNNVLLEVLEQTNFSIQVFGIALVPGRAYHLCGIFEGNGYGDEVRFFIDGVKMLNAEPATPAPGTANLDARTANIATFGDPTYTVGLGGDAVLLQAARNGSYNEWAMWDGADAILTDTEVREELFEKGALPDQTIATGTESAMQTALDGLSDTTPGNVTNTLRVSAVSGGGDLTLDFDSVITFDPLASIHIQYMGTDTLTAQNTGTTDIDADKISTPNGGTVVLEETAGLDLTVLSASDSSVVVGARVIIRAAAGGDITAGTVLVNDVTVAGGTLSSTFTITGDQPISGVIRKGTSSTYFKTAQFTATALFANAAAGEAGELTVLMVEDE